MKIKRILIIIVIVLTISIVVLFPIVSLFTKTFDHKYFTSIEEFHFLQDYLVENSSLDDDEYLGTKIVVDSFTEKINYEGNTYNVYAYVFADSESSIAYFNQYTGKNSKTDWNFSMSSNYYFNSKYIAYHENCLYRIEGGNYLAFVDAVNLITSNFSVTYDSLKGE